MLASQLANERKIELQVLHLIDCMVETTILLITSYNLMNLVVLESNMAWFLFSHMSRPYIDYSHLDVNSLLAEEIPVRHFVPLAYHTIILL